MENKVIYENGNSYTTFPDIEKLNNGHIVVGFREAVRRRWRCHIDPTSKATLVRSTDGGSTWGSRVVVYEEEGRGIQDPSIKQLEDGTLIANFFKWATGSEESVPEDPAFLRGLDSEHYAWCEGTFVVRSYDGGVTWEKEAIKVESPAGNATATSDAVLELPDGQILTVYYMHPLDEDWRDGHARIEGSFYRTI